MEVTNDQDMYPIDSRVPFTEVEHECWLKFKDLNWSHDPYFFICKKYSEVAEVSIDLDHCIVPCLSKFAIGCFNELCQHHVKKLVYDNIYEAEVIKVKYSRCDSGFLFYITLEAMEEDSPGVYEALVFCRFDDGRRTLLKFIRSPCAPVGRKFKGVSDLICEKSVLEAVKEEKKALKAELKIRGGLQGCDDTAEFISMKKSYKDIKAACRILDKYDQKVEPVGWKIKKNNPDDWHVPEETSGLRLRSVDHSCGGYDFHNPLTSL